MMLIKISAQRLRLPETGRGAVAQSVRKSASEPSDRDLHRIRIRSKNARYAAEAFIPIAGSPAKRFASRMEALQTALGAQHDAVFAGLQLRRQIEIAPCAFALGKLVASRTQLLPPAAVPGLVYGNALRENRCAFGGNGFESKAAPARENVAGELPEEP